MEVCISHVENAPDGCMLALTAGHSRRLAPLVTRQKFAFASQAANAAATDGGCGMKIEVLALQGSTRVDAGKLTAGTFGTGVTAPKAQRFEVPVKLADGTMRVGLTVRPAAPGEKGKAVRDYQQVLRAASPDSGKEFSVPKYGWKKKPRLVNIDDLAASTAEAQGKRLGKPAPHNVALEARAYLEEHRILPFVENMMRVLVADRPSDPWRCIASLFPQDVPDFFSGLPAVEEGKDTSVQETNVGPVAEKPILEPVHPEPSPKAVTKTTLFKEEPPLPKSHGIGTGPNFGKTSQPLQVFTAVEFTADNLIYAELMKHLPMCGAVIAQVQNTFSLQLGVRASNIDVELGSGSLVVATRIKVLTEMAAENLRAQVDEKKKGIVQALEEDLLNIPGVEIAMKQSTSQSLGLRGFRSFIRHRLQISEPGAATASTAVPPRNIGAMRTTGESWMSLDDAPTMETTMLSPMMEPELSDITVPTSVAATGGEVLRRIAKWTFIQSKLSGALVDTLESTSRRKAASLSAQTKETLLKALREGVLGQTLHSASQIREEIRVTARTKILQGIENGNLERALNKALGAPIGEDAEERVVGDVQAEDPTKPMSPRALRISIKESLLAAGLTRSLVPTLVGVVEENRAKARNPRPASMAPFAPFYREHFRSVDLEDDFWHRLHSRFLAPKRAQPDPQQMSQTSMPPPVPAPTASKDADAQQEEEDVTAFATEGVAMDVKMSNMNFDALVSDDDLLAEFKDETARAIAAAAGEGVLPEHVVLEIVRGSVIVKARILVPPNAIVGNAEENLRAQISSELGNTLQRIERLSTVVTGGSAVQIGPPAVHRIPVVDEESKKQALRQVKQTFQKRQKDDESAKVVEDELRRAEEERRKREIQEREQKIQFEKEVEEELQKSREAAEQRRLQAKLEEDEALQKMVEEELKRKQREEEEEAARTSKAEKERALLQKREAETAQELYENEVRRRNMEEKLAAQRKEAAAAQERYEKEIVRRKIGEEQEKRVAEQRREAEELEKRKLEEQQEQQEAEERLARWREMQEEEKQKKQQEMQQVAATLAQLVPSDGNQEIVPRAARGNRTPAQSDPTPGNELEIDICIGDRVEIVNSLYVGQDGMEVLAGWQGSVEEINDGDAVVLFYGMDEGRYVLREDFANMIVMRADSSVSSSSADVIAAACTEALTHNESLRAQNAALRVELDRLLALATPMSTPPLTGASIPRQEFSVQDAPGTPSETPPCTSTVGYSERKAPEIGTPSYTATVAGSARACGPQPVKPQGAFGATVEIGTPGDSPPQTDVSSLRP